MNKKLPYLIALSALAVCLPAVSQAQGFVKGAARAIKGGEGAVKIAQSSIKTPTVPGLEQRVERAIAEQKISVFHGIDYRWTTQEAAQRALKAAIYRNESDLIKPLIAKGAQLNFVWPSGTTPLTHAIEQGALETVKELLQNGADINLPNHWGETPLILAAKKGNYAMVKLLLDNGAKVDLQDDSGFTALMRTDNEKIAKLLLDKGANPNHQDEEGWTKLMYIAYAGYKADAEKTKALVDLATLLLENGAKVNLQKNRGKTALILALDVCNFAMTKLLLEHGADPYIVDDQGLNAFDVARWAERHRDRWDLLSLVNVYKK